MKVEWKNYFIKQDWGIHLFKLFVIVGTQVPEVIFPSVFGPMPNAVADGKHDPWHYWQAMTKKIDGNEGRTETGDTSQGGQVRIKFSSINPNIPKAETTPEWENKECSRLINVRRKKKKAMA